MGLVCVLGDGVVMTEGVALCCMVCKVRGVLK
jgi:hypothetical protein